MKSLSSLLKRLFTRSSPADRLTARGRAHFAAGEYAEAISDASDAIEHEPQHAGAYRLRAEAKLKRADFNGAMFDLQRLAALEPQNVEVLLLLGEAREGLNDLEGAIAEYGRVLECEPRELRALTARALLEEKLERLEEAVADYTRGIELKSAEQPRLLIARAKLREELGDLKGAMDDYAEAAFVRGQELQERSDFQQAIEHYNKALEFDARHAASYFNRGLCKMQLSDSLGAQHDFETAIELEPNYSSQVPKN